MLTHRNFSISLRETFFLVRIFCIRTEKNAVFGHFSRSDVMIRKDLENDHLQTICKKNDRLSNFIDLRVKSFQNN